MRRAVAEKTGAAVTTPAKRIDPKGAVRITHAGKQSVAGATRALTPLFDDNEANKIVITCMRTPRRLYRGQSASGIR